MDFSLNVNFRMFTLCWDDNPSVFAYYWNLRPKHEVVLLNVFQIVFEAQRGTGVGGEIGLDNVVLTSGPCQDDVSPVF